MLVESIVYSWDELHLDILYYFIYIVGFNLLIFCESFVSVFIRDVDWLNFVSHQLLKHQGYPSIIK